MGFGNYRPGFIDDVGPLRREMQMRALRTVARHSEDVTEALRFADMLGLIPLEPEDKASSHSLLVHRPLPTV